MPTNTRDTGCCNLCGAKSVGSEAKIKMWIKLHFKQNHSDKEIITMGTQQTKFDRTSRRYQNKYDFAQQRKEIADPVKNKI